MKFSKIIILFFIGIFFFQVTTREVFANSILSNLQQDITAPLYSGGHNFGFIQRLGNSLDSSYRFLKIRTMSTSTDTGTGNGIRMWRYSNISDPFWETSVWYSSIATTTDSEGYLTLDLGSSYTFDPAKYYAIEVSFASGAPLGDIYGGTVEHLYPLLNPWNEACCVTSDFNSLYFELSNNGIFDDIPPSNTSTRFISTIPINGDTIATTTTATTSFTAYINIDDWDSTYNDQYFSIKITPLEPINPRPNVLYGPIPITTFGNFTFSTTTSFTYIGRQKMEITMFEPYFHIPFTGIGWGWHEVMSTTTTFTVATTSPLGLKLGVIDRNIRDIMASTTADLSSNCKPFGSDFNIVGCLLGIVLPSEQALADDLLILKHNPPFGYIFRLIEIMATTSTSSLPVISYVSAGSSMFGTSTFTFDPFGALASADSPLKYTSDQEIPKTATQIFSYVIDIAIYLTLILLMISHLIGLRFHSDFGATPSQNQKGDNAYRLKETLYKKSYRGSGGYGPFRKGRSD